MPGASGRVLVVDDNKVIRQLIRVNLELEGFEVVTAADGAECLRIVRRARPDVVTLDVAMPRLDGIETAARLRADRWTRDVRIAVVSACSEAEVERGAAVGVDTFLGKPFEPGRLVAVVRGLVRASVRGGAGVPGDAGGFAAPGGPGGAVCSGASGSVVRLARPGGAAATSGASGGSGVFRGSGGAGMAATGSGAGSSVVGSGAEVMSGAVRGGVVPGVAGASAAVASGG